MSEATEKKVNKIAVFVKSLMLAYVMTGVLLLVLAFLLYKLNMNQGSVEIGILLIYIVSCFAGGFMAGKLGKNKKYLWGLTTGILYVAALLLVSFIVNGEIGAGMGGCLAIIALCSGAGMLGGMVS